METLLYQPVKAFLEELGFVVKGEIGGCDLLALREGDPPVVVVGELKLARLVEARKKAGITQTQLAVRLGRPQSFVAKYEGRERRLDVAEFVGIARTIGTDPYRLLRGAEKT